MPPPSTALAWTAPQCHPASASPSRSRFSPPQPPSRAAHGRVPARPLGHLTRNMSKSWLLQGNPRKYRGQVPRDSRSHLCSERLEFAGPTRTERRGLQHTDCVPRNRTWGHALLEPSVPVVMSRKVCSPALSSVLEVDPLLPHFRAEHRGPETSGPLLWVAGPRRTLPNISRPRCSHSVLSDRPIPCT